MNEIIYDRTSVDVALASRIRKEKIQNNLELSNDEINMLERGFVTINTLNRIEIKQIEIKTLLNDMGYYNTPTKNKTWGYEDVFWKDDLERIFNNNIILRQAFYALKSSPKNAIVKYHYEEFNALEKVLFDISQNIEYTASKFKRCGIFNCREE